MIKFNRSFLNIFLNQCIRTYATHEKILAGRQNKRGSMLSKMIDNRDKNKKWHLNFMEQAPRAKSIFEGIRRPKKRQNMLESLFIKNITDVLSTGEIIPEIIGLGVEINGVKISSCYKTLNVYWQVPFSSYEKHEEIAVTLNASAPRLRAELISRNVMGKVPYIFFIRDVTNAKIAAFENALRDADFGPDNERSIIPDDTFTKDVLVFRDRKKSKTEEEVKEEKKETCKKNPSSIPERPKNMKSDVFGLKHDTIMNRILSSRGKTKSPSSSSAVVSSEHFPSSELFDKIPGTTLQGGVDRSKLLKQFEIERKMERNKNRSIRIRREDSLLEHEQTSPSEEYVEVAAATDSQDYLEEDNPDSSFR